MMCKWFTEFPLFPTDLPGTRTVVFIYQNLNKGFEFDCIISLILELKTKVHLKQKKMWWNWESPMEKSVTRLMNILPFLISFGGCLKRIEILRRNGSIKADPGALPACVPEGRTFYGLLRLSALPNGNPGSVTALN